MYNRLKLRVDADIEIVEAKRQKEKEERRERVRKQREERLAAYCGLSHDLNICFLSCDSMPMHSSANF